MTKEGLVKLLQYLEAIEGSHFCDYPHDREMIGLDSAEDLAELAEAVNIVRNAKSGKRLHDDPRLGYMDEDSLSGGEQQNSAEQ